MFGLIRLSPGVEAMRVQRASASCGAGKGARPVRKRVTWPRAATGLPPLQRSALNAPVHCPSLPPLQLRRLPENTRGGHGIHVSPHSVSRYTELNAVLQVCRLCISTPKFGTGSYSQSPLSWYGVHNCRRYTCTYMSVDFRY